MNSGVTYTKFDMVNHLKGMFTKSEVNYHALISWYYLCLVLHVRMMMMVCLILSALLLLVFSPFTSPIAPSDFDTACTGVPVPESTVVLLDTYNYVSLPWISIDMDNNNVSVSHILQ